MSQRIPQTGRGREVQVKCISEKPREASSLTLLCFWKVKARRDLRGGGNEGIKKLRYAAGV